MASIAHDKNGCRRILFVAPDGKRKTVRLGKASQRMAEGVKYRVEQLSAFFRQEFHSHATYRIICPDKPRLAKMLDRFRKELSNY